MKNRMNLFTALKKLILFHKATLATALGLLLHCTAVSQPETQFIQETFSQHREKNLQEKIYVHLDRTSYLTGEILWFKIYLVDASFHKPLDLSKVAYFEILSDQTPVLQAKIDIKQGFGNGSLFLPATLSSGTYLVRAYSNWMKNNDPDFYYQQPVTIINTFRSLATKPATAGKMDVQFFPEGGNLVNGITSKVAFKITDQSGNALSAGGALVNEQNDTLTTLSTLKYGLGSFTFTPSLEHKATVLMKDLNGIIHSFALPPIIPEGYGMSLVDENDHLTITVSSTKSTSENMLLFAHSRQVITWNEVKSLVNGQVTFHVQKNILRDGVNHFTIFNQSLQPVCERLYFIQPRTRLDIGVTANQPEYGTRRKVTLDVAALDRNQKVADANLSVSVLKIDSLQLLERADILSYFYLTSELVGHIESPGYYFSDSDQFVKEATENLMLTHGWRRFKWENILNKKQVQPEFVPENRGHLVKGIVRDVSGNPAQNVETYVSVPGRNIRLYLSRSNKDGLVQYEMRNFFGPQKLIAQTNPRKDSTYRIEIRNPFSNQFSRYSIPPFKISPLTEKNLLNRAIAMQVQDVFYEENLNRFQRPVSDSSAFYGKADETYLLDDYTRFPVMDEVMREYVKGVWVRKRKNGFHFLVMDNVNQAVFDEDPLLLMDGVPAFDVNKIMDLNPLQISKLEVLTRKYYLGDQSFPGIVSYTSYAGDMAGFQLDPQTLTLDYEGLQLQREFFSPHYETERQRSSRMPDQRILLHWAPDVRTTNGKAQIEFYTADLDGNFLVIVEGLSSTGVPGSGSTQFRVIPKQK